MAKDWVAWHDEYDDAGSSLSRRLDVVRRYVADALGLLSHRRPLRILSMCAGDGRDLLPVLGAHPEGGSARARLIEIDPGLAAAAAATADRLGLSGVHVLCADAGVMSAYADAGPADLVLACGVFGNISAAHGERTVGALQWLTAPGGIVIWTRGRGASGDPSLEVRRWFCGAGFEELSFCRPSDAKFRVGMHRKTGSVEAPPLPARLFTFVQMTSERASAVQSGHDTSARSHP